MNNTKRNYGVDILRITAMLGVVIIHIIGHGGLLDNANDILQFSILSFIKILVLPAVDCFVLISGYVGYRESKYYPRIKNLISLFWVVLFYSVTFAIIFIVIYPSSVSVFDLIQSFTPIISNQYWFFTAYFGLFVCSPYLNLLVHKADKKQLFILAVVLLFFSCCSLIKDPFLIKNGYSFIWFIFVYLLGAIIKKYNIASLFPKRVWMYIVLAILVFVFLSSQVFYVINIPMVKNNWDLLLHNSSPFILLMAVCWLCLFSRINCKENLYSTVNFFSVSSFSVYLIHDNIFVREYLIQNISNITKDYNGIALIAFIFCCALVIFSLCILLDKFRLFLFRIIKINIISENIELCIKKIFSSIYYRII